MIDPFEYKGVWSTPDNSQNEVTGTVFFGPQSGIVLETIGSLSNLQLKTPLDTQRFKFINGFTTTGKKITLYFSHEFNRKTSTPGMITSKYSAQFAFIGEHFKNDNELKFNRISGHFNKLENWISEYGFEIVDTDFHAMSTKVEYQLPKDIPFELSSGVSGKFQFNFSPPLSKNTNKVSIEQKTSVSFNSDKEIPFDHLLRDFLHFRDFLTIGLFESTYPTSIFASSSIPGDNSGEHLPEKGVEVFFQNATNSVTNDNVINWQFLFNYWDVEPDFNTIISRWYDDKEKLEPIKSLLLDSFFKEGNFSENSFLDMCHAIESFHRRCRNNKVLTNEEHQKMLKEIIESVDEEHKVWLSGKLSFSNEPTLQFRLNEIINELELSTIGKIIDDVELFVKEVKNSRNYYTHYDVKLKKKAKKGNDLFQLSEKLRVILICAILKETGFSVELIESLLQRNEWVFFNHIIN